MELLAFGKTGWGDELFYATLMTVAVSITAMLVGFFFALDVTNIRMTTDDGAPDTGCTRDALCVKFDVL